MRLVETLLRYLKGGRHAGRTEVVETGRGGFECRDLYPVSLVREQAVSDLGGIRVLARACADERGRDPGALPEDPIRRESQVLIAAARRTGCFLDMRMIPGTRYTIRSGESEVRWYQEDQSFYKIKDPFAKLHLKKHSPELVLYEHVIQNLLFPDCRLGFLGVTEDYHAARLVFRQQAVRSDCRPSDGQIADCLSRLGLQSDGRYSFGNDILFVTDVGQDGDNVLVDDGGFLRFIDPLIGFKGPLCQLLSACVGDSTAAECEIVAKLTECRQ